nr:unnamed protein product [Callosobruchus analis]
MAGKAWYYAFMKRHKNLSLRLPEKKLIDKESFNALTVQYKKEIKRSLPAEENTKLEAYQVVNVALTLQLYAVKMLLVSVFLL